MVVSGVVRSWDAEQGWGVIDTSATPGGCWAHFSALDMAGYRSLDVGDRVSVEFEVARQDGYAYRAVHVLPEGARRVPAAPDGPADAAHSNRLTLHSHAGDLIFDSDRDPPERLWEVLLPDQD